MPKLPDARPDQFVDPASPPASFFVAGSISLISGREAWPSWKSSSVCSLSVRPCCFPFWPASPSPFTATFVVEERFGFNRTTSKTFIFDILKGMLLVSSLGHSARAHPVVLCPCRPLRLAILLAGRGPLHPWFTISCPVLIMPLFNKFSPLPDGDIARRSSNYARRQRLHTAGNFHHGWIETILQGQRLFHRFWQIQKNCLFRHACRKALPPGDTRCFGP